MKRRAERPLQRDADILAHVRCGNTAEIWNERTSRAARPRPARSRGDVAAVEDDAPALGSRNLVSRLKTVVLPAPLGPISAWIVPRRTLRSTPLHRGEAAELLGQALGRENEIVHRSLPCRPRAAARRTLSLFCAATLQASPAAATSPAPAAPSL